MPELHKLGEPESLIKVPKNGTRLTFVILAIQFLMVFANLYLSNGYVSKATYENDEKDLSRKRDELNIELRTIAIEIKGLNDEMQGQAVQDKRLDDLEQRMREQERRK